MNGPDDLQKLWQSDEGKPKDATMWRKLIQEKRTGWDEVVGTEDQAWYLIALCFLPLTAWAAWKAKYPWVQVGYGLMAATIVLGTIATWIVSRQKVQERDRNLREHLEALIASYDRRARFIWRWGWWAIEGLCVGLVAVILGIPHNAANLRAWVIAMLLVAGVNILQWLNCGHSIAKILRKREEAARLLQNLLAGAQDVH